MTHSIRAYRTTQDERKNTINLRFIAFIAINLIFAMPCLNAGLADWISDNLPKTWQVSQEYRDEVKHIQGKTGKPVPIIFVNSNRDSLGSALNFGVGPLRFAMMLINQKKFSANTSDDNTQTLAHETKHIDENHGGVQHAAYLGVMAMGVWSLVSRQIPENTPENAQELTRLRWEGLAITALTIGIGKAILWTRNIPKYESEAEQGSFEKLKKLGYCKVLEQQAQDYKKDAETFPKDARPRGSNYPTLGEYIAWSEKACKECGIGINPAERPDSPNLMRNGSPVKQAESQPMSWYETIFGKKS